MVAGMLSVAYLRFANAHTGFELNWIRMQEREQALAGKTSKIRYLCVNEMAFALNQGDKKFVPGEDKIVIIDEDIKKRCRLPWMPFFDDVSMVMSAVSPTNGYGALLVTMGGDPNLIGIRLNQSGWRESEASTRLHHRHATYDGYLYEQKDAWMLVVLKKGKNPNKTTALFAGQWDPKMMAYQ